MPAISTRGVQSALRFITFFVALVCVSTISRGQLTLGTSPYSQNFDAVGTAIPTGWSVYTGASTTSLGSSSTFSTTKQGWLSGAGGFVNFASTTSTVGNGGILLNSSSSTANQSSSTNRALGLQQTAAFADPGGSFDLQLTNTTGKSGFSMSFSLQQGANAAGRTTLFSVDYGAGTSPTTFTSLTTSPVSISTTAGTFGSTTVTVNFGTALDNIGQNVWIRIWTSTSATGSGSRAATGIDDFQLTWSTTPTVSISNTGTPAAATVASNTTNYQFSTFNLNATSATDFTALKFTESGTATSSDVSNFRVIYDANANGLLDASEITGSVVGSSMPFSSTINFAITGQTSFTGSRTYFLIADIASGATAGHTITSSIAASSDVTTSITNRTGTAIGNTQTIAGFLTNASDYFQSNVTTGDWATAASWQSSHDGTNFYTATAAPTSAANTITILANQKIGITSSISADQLIINGTLEIQSGGIINLNDGTGDDITINSGGILHSLGLATYATEFVPSGSAAVHVKSGGRVTIGSGSTIAGSNQYLYAATSSTSNNIWDDGSIFEWNTTSSPGASGFTYFPNSATGVPIFKISAACSIAGGTATTVNGELLLAANFNTSGAGTRTFRNGISGAATFTQGASAGSVKITGAGAILDGTALNIVLTSPISLSSSVSVPTGATVTVSGSNIDNSTTPGSLTINGTLDITTIQITNTSGTISVNGKLRTAYTGLGGLTGTNAAIPSGTVALNSGSTIEYYASAAQYVTCRTDYYNLSILAGAKTLATTSICSPIGGTVSIGTGASLDVSSTTFGGSGTNLTLVGTGKFLNAGSGVKPDMSGTYTCGTGSTVEFDGSSATNIRLENYYNVIVAGSNVSTSTNTAVINLPAGGTFTVASGGVFKTRSASGFSGSTGSSVGSTNSPSIVLAQGSTIDYSEGSLVQTISNQIPYQNLTISGAAATINAPAGTLTIQGDFKKTGSETFVHNNGTVLFNGSIAQGIYVTATTQPEFYNFTNSNAVGLTAYNDFGIAKQLTLNDGSVLNVNAGKISLRSSATNTANVGQVGTAVINYTGTGGFYVERYITHARKWQFLSVPVTTTQTVRDAWMEGATLISQNPVPGYGTIVTDGNATAVSNGFDAYSAGGPSVKYWNGTAYTGISSPSILINSHEGYFNYVRGDRSSLPSPVTYPPTVLRSFGKLKTGALNVAVTAGQITAVGNPYASQIDIRQLYSAASSNISANFYIWDPQLTSGYGLGAYQTITQIGSDFYATPGGGSFAAPSGGVTLLNTIESGQAFFVQGTSGGAAVPMFTEAAKTTGSSTVNFTASNPQLLSAALYKADAGGNKSLLDGCLVTYANGQNDSVDLNDAVKLLNTNENVSMRKGGEFLSVEKRSPLDDFATDTIFLNAANLRLMNYEWTFTINNMDLPGRDGYLIDRFRNDSLQLNLSGTNLYDFAVTSAAGSYAADRFMIVFRPTAAGGVVPVTFTGISAARQADKSVLVKWATALEINIDHYELQRSADGVSFTTISANVQPTSNLGAAANYFQADQSALVSNIYYRVKAVNINGNIQYSAIAHVAALGSSDQVSIVPNPVAGHNLNLELSGLAAGRYTLIVYNSVGARVYNTEFSADGAAQNKQFTLPGGIAPGIYEVEIAGAQKPIRLKAVIK